ncbi:MAG: response regulator transcription factor [Lachnospiraceae bacterium]|nr:response regulator transcription factor [Lachnospiraceae bacterium]
MIIAICDKEAPIRGQLRDLIRKQEPDSRIVEFTSAEELLDFAESIDLLFLDIPMDGMNGMEAARELRARPQNMLIVFVTAMREYVFEAFDVAAFQYLLKPIDQDKFGEVFRRARETIESKEKESAESQVLLFKTKQKTYSLKKQDIYYAENQLKKVILHTVDENIEIYGSMRELAKQLGHGFYRCHRGYLVNMQHIVEYNSDSIGLSNGEKVFLSKEKYNEFVKSYMSYLKK